MKTLKLLTLTMPIGFSVITGCSSTPPCEDILEVKKQTQLCQKLQKVMKDPENPTQALVARERFKTECENLRYYRDDYDTICKGEQQPIGQKQTKPKSDNKR